MSRFSHPLTSVQFNSIYVQFKYAIDLWKSKVFMFEIYSGFRTLSSFTLEAIINIYKIIANQKY